MYIADEVVVQMSFLYQSQTLINVGIIIYRLNIQYVNS